MRLLSFFSPLLIAVLFTGCGQNTPPETKKADIPPPVPAPAPPPEDKRPIVLCFGDSITAGFGLEVGQAYTDILQKILDERGYSYHIVNAGISGDTTQGGLDRLSDALRTPPKIVLLELGGNDGLRGIPVSRSRDNLQQIATRFTAAGAKVILLGITLPRNYGPDYVREFEAMYKTIAQANGYPLLPFVLENVYGVPGMMQPDGIHPTAPGAARLAANVLKILEPQLKK
ncbi:MAG: arylesterase [Acidobacteriota bacterium]